MSVEQKATKSPQPKLETVRNADKSGEDALKLPLYDLFQAVEPFTFD